jgi:Fe2+ or Zn2+ uptake regulation protein
MRVRLQSAFAGLPGAGKAGGIRPCPSAGDLHAFVACRQPGCEGHESIAFTICETCGQVTEITDDSLARRLKTMASEARFALKKSTIELRGICCACEAPER